MNSNNHIYELALGNILSKVLTIAAKLNLDTYLTTSKDINILTQELNCHPIALKKFLRVLEAYEIVQIDGDIVSPTELTSALVQLKTPHLIDAYKAVNELECSLQTNKECWSKAYGQEFFPYLNEHPEKLQQFSDWCNLSATNWLPVLFSLYDFAKFDTIADIAGGTGYLISKLLTMNPTQNGILFDQPSVIEHAKIQFVNSDISARLEFIGGDFFKTIPSSADCYIICRTLLNWSDEDAIKILNRCYLDMPDNAVLLIVDFVVPNKDHPHYKRTILNDLNLLALASSSNRTKEEWEQLVAQSQLNLTKVIISSDKCEPEPIAPIIILECTK